MGTRHHVGALGFALLIGDVNLLLVYVVAFLLGSGETLFDTASEALVPNIVSPSELDAANGRLQASEWAANTFVGPPFGAALFAAAAAVPFLFDAGSIITAAVLVSAIGGSFRTSERMGDAPGRLRNEIGEGLSWLWHHTVLRTLSLMAGVTNLVGMGIIAIFVLFAQDILGLGDVGFGLILATIRVGGLIGAVGALLITSRFGPGITLIASQIGLGAGAVVVGATSKVAVAAGVVGFYGMLIGLRNVAAVTLRQRLTPDDIRGRVASVARLPAWETQPLGALLGGVVAAVYGLRAPFFVAAVVWGLVAVVAAPFVSNRRITALERSA